MLLADLFLLRPTPYRHACESPRAALVTATFIAATGVLYGALVAVMQRAMGGQLQGIPISEVPAAILFGGNILSGIVITIAVHAGLTLVAWLMARAIGGPGLLIGLYRTTAYLLPLGWPALPQIARSAAAAAAAAGGAAPVPLGGLYLPLAAVGLALFLAGLYQVFLITQDKGPVRSAVAVVLFAAFSFSILLIVHA